MESSGQIVRQWLEAGNVSASTVARRSGVSRSTLHRVLGDIVDPSVGTLTEIAIACGRSFDLSTRPLSDPLAAAAARVILESDYLAPREAEVARWQERLFRLAEGDDPIAIIRAAADASSPLARQRGVFYRGEETTARLASAGDATGKQWAISGAAGLTPEAPTAPPVTLLWCEDPLHVSHLLTMSALHAAQRRSTMTVAVLEAEPELFADSFTLGGIRYAAPIQIVLDCVAQGGAVADAAIELVRRW